MDKQYYGHANISISQQQGGGSKRVYFVHGSEWPIFRAQIWFFFGNRVWGGGVGSDVNFICFFFRSLCWFGSFCWVSLVSN